MSIRQDCVKRYLDYMMKADMPLYEKILDTPVFAANFNKLIELALSEFSERKTDKRRKEKVK